MDSGLVISSKDRRIRALLGLSVLLLAALTLLFPADSAANDFDQVVAAAFDQVIGEVEISESDVSSLTISEQELLPMFPEVEGNNLEKRSFRLPSDFEGEANLVFIAFRRPQQAEVETWLPLTKDLVERHAGLRFYELPTISARDGMARYFINSGMRQAIQDRKARELTIPLYLDKESFLQALEIPDEESIHILLVGNEGRIHWRAKGALTDESAAGLDRALARRLQAAARVADYDPADSLLADLADLD
jgi:hypothetical protein